MDPRFDLASEDGAAVLRITGDLDIAAEDDAVAAVAAVLATEPAPAHLVLDLSAVEFMDSSGLRAVVLADQKLRAQGLRFALVRGGEPVHRVFELTRMTDRLTWVDTPGDLVDGAEERR